MPKQSELDSGALAFAFVARNDLHPSDELPFALGDSSQGGDNGNSGQTEAVKRTGRLLIAQTAPAQTRANCYRETSRGVPIAQCLGMDYGVTVQIAQCYRAETGYLSRIANCHHDGSTSTVGVGNCHVEWFANIQALANCPGESSSPVVALASCLQGVLLAPQDIANCTSGCTPPVVALANCTIDKQMAVALYHCFMGDTVPTVPVPCEWYDIDLGDYEPPYQPPCGEPPPSDELPFAFVRRESQSPDSDMLSFPFLCHYTPQENRKKTYMLYNEVSTHVDGKPIQIYSAKIDTSMDSFCWQFDVEISHEDFALLRLETRSDKPLLALSINGHEWVMLVEDYAERKSFNRDSYTLTGRSQTAQLASDYFRAQTQLIDRDLYAGQLAQQQLVDTPFTLMWDSDADGFIPKDTYTVSGSPIDTLLDLAEASGHYVESHPNQPTLYVRKRYPKPAWEIASEDANRQISALTWLELVGRASVNTRYNMVRLAGSGAHATGARIFRQKNAGIPLPEAPTIEHAIYAGDDNNTPVALFRNKGIQVLSDSGKHKIYRITQIWADDPINPENVPLAKLGEIVEVLDVNGSLGKGIVTAVSVDVGENNDATEILQTFTVNVYLDD